MWSKIRRYGMLLGLTVLGMFFVFVVYDSFTSHSRYSVFVYGSYLSATEDKMYDLFKSEIPKMRKALEGMESTLEDISHNVDNIEKTLRGESTTD